MTVGVTTAENKKKILDFMIPIALELHPVLPFGACHLPDTSAPGDRQSDLALRRRLAWGLSAGKTRAEVAAAEGLAPEQAATVLAAPGTFLLMNVWALLALHRQQGGRTRLLALTRWAMDHVARHADSCAVGAGIGMARIVAFCLRLSYGAVLRSLLRHLDEVQGRGPRNPLRGIRAKLVEALAWAIEVAVTQQLVQRYSTDRIEALDEAFRAAIARGELPDITWQDGTEVRAVPAAPTSPSPPSPPAASPATTTAVAPARPLADLRRVIGPSMRPPAGSLPIRPPNLFRPSTVVPLDPERWRPGLPTSPPSVRSRPVRRAA